jgi:hypothetical protein
MLIEEAERRTRIRWQRSTRWPAGDRAVIAVGRTASLRRSPEGRAALGAEALGPARPEGYHLRAAAAGAAPRVWVAGDDARGVLFGVGHLLRTLRLERDRASLDAPLRVDTWPAKPLRGHQLGYRPKCNSYDGWTVAMWEQYIRDLVIFGCNAIELIPPRSDDDPDSSHFPLPQMRMMIEMSRICADYGLDVWIWYPAMDPDYSNPSTVDSALKEWAEVFRQLPRIDTVFVPGGDPGHTPPRHLMALLEKQARNLRRYHPRATMWFSPQSFTSAWMDEFYDLVRKEPSWLGGIAYGPQVRVPLGELRAKLPPRYPIRDYPDITHSRHCQYPVPAWDLALAVTEGRESINPRPTQMAQIFRVTTQPHTIGFISYSEGCNDDVNKAVWSALGWNPRVDIPSMLQEYSRYFVSAAHAADFARGLLGLERNWVGSVATNTGIRTTWELFESLDKKATPQEKQNWRFQQAVYRACYDRYVQLRLAADTAAEAAALDRLGEASTRGAMDVIDTARALLRESAARPAAPELETRLRILAEALFQSIHMQLSTDLYDGMRGRGDNLDDRNHPLNNRVWLDAHLAQIRAMPSEKERLEALSRIVHWSDPGPGGFHDKPGIPGQQPHVLAGVGWENDPAFFVTAHTGFPDEVFQEKPVPLAWCTSAEAHYDAPLRMRYTGLDARTHYRVRVVYGHGRTTAKVRLMADESREVHPWLQKENEPIEFDIPAEATSDGVLTLTWWPEPGRGGNGRFLELAEVWLYPSQ